MGIENVGVFKLKILVESKSDPVMLTQRNELGGMFIVRPQWQIDCRLVYNAMPEEIG